MSFPLPDVLQSLLSAPDSKARESAWTAFLKEYGGLVLHVARSMGGDYDAAMDRYAFVLEALRREDYRRLRGYVADGCGRFTTWLIVVVRRLCHDHHRRRYGRTQSDSRAALEQRAGRRQLEDLLSEELGLAALESRADEAPDAALSGAELSRGLARALEALDPADRLILRLRFEDDCSVPEIARLLGEGSPFRLYRRIERILTTVRQRLQAAGIEDSVP
ncbi:MAG TPA: sigma-70 family RNA polymerase sigma factor [Gemmatimonadales bacterium]|jgi:RNA polymerase sigma factor (sigma-70 family)